MRRRRLLACGVTASAGGCIHLLPRKVNDCEYSYVTLPEGPKSYPEPRAENWQNPDPDVIESFEHAYAYNREYRDSFDKLAVGVKNVAMAETEEYDVVTVGEVSIASYSESGHGDHAWSATYFFQDRVSRAEGHAHRPPQDADDSHDVVVCD